MQYLHQLPSNLANLPTQLIYTKTNSPQNVILPLKQYFA